ncbi:MAG: SOS response-associated peptidase family protein [Desulfosporosinus sp.]|nr:SOS response-associated peptidase family protein [Desulfosporosinus sp.]
MCGRFSIIDIEDIRERFKTKPIDLKPNYNVAPSQDVPVITGNQLSLFRWGLIPFWAKDPSIGNKLINARAETVPNSVFFNS